VYPEIVVANWQRNSCLWNEGFWDYFPN